MTLTVASSGEGQRKNALVRTIKRTSGLEAPIVALSGAHGVSLAKQVRHDCALGETRLRATADGKGEITACKFDPSGQTLAACSIDRGICTWRRL